MLQRSSFLHTSLILLFAFTGATAEMPDGPAALLAGEYDNQAQMDALPEGVGREIAWSGEWINFQSANFHRVAGANLEGEVIYLQWSDSDEKVSRQRLWVFRPLDDETVAMDFYGFREPEAWVELQADTNRQAELTADDLVSYPAGCTLTFRRIPDGWAGALNPETCSILTQETRKEMTLESWTVITGDAVWYHERGHFPDGKIAFIVPGIDRYVFTKR